MIGSAQILESDSSGFEASLVISMECDLEQLA